MTKIFNPLGRMMQRRDFLKVAGASVAVAGLPAAVRAAEPVKVLVWSWVPNLQLEVDMFNAAHPGIQIELVNPGQGTRCITRSARACRRAAACRTSPRSNTSTSRASARSTPSQTSASTPMAIRASSPKAYGRRSPWAMWSTPRRRITVRWRCSIARTSSTSMGSRRPPPGPSLPMRARRSMRPIRLCS